MNTESKKPQKYRIAFFGTPQFAVDILNELKAAGIVPELVVTAPDKPAGRKLLITPPPVKVWAQKHNIEISQPGKLDSEFAAKLKATSYQLFIVAAYGKIIPEDVLAIPRRGALNVHPSLLPRHRGSSPIEGQILAGDGTVGVTIMLLDREMDHGPIVAQEKMPMPEPLPRGHELETILAHAGGKLLAEVIPRLITGELTARPQEHAAATYTKKITKE